ncbi:uncharacterized protein LOC124931169 [Impatiens glandulifera]|uniref:uncharacterized protein LOC124931169 n=1 Tax=Impatiens glandulifera TaxID=253017 RepID=UPI001FB18D59|nr:uncharacterized protein LOC124931169 [Impatiens glandulifera]
MSPASRSKSKDKKAGKEPEKTPSKPSGFTGPVSGYNPLLGKFHALEISHTSTPLSNSNGRFRNIDETDDQSAISLGTGLDFDAVSNNGSWSGESEDTKEKTSSHQASRQESVPGADNEKREKIRQKNEKKHQRQKERRAQELHERCSGFLMSRKLEALSQQLVAMGFTSERATMALILNEGKIEESVAWLFEGVEEEEADRHKESNNLDGGSLKIDITEELAQIVEMEAKYNCSKQEVERAVVACEGDIEKAAETLRLPKEELSFAPPKPEETVDDHSKFPVPRIQPRPPSLSNNMLQQQPRKEEKNFNYTKAAPVPVPIGVLPNVAPSTKAGVAKLEWANPQQISTTMEKRWTNGGVGGSNPSVSSYPTAPPIQANPSAKVEARYGLLSSELKHLQLGSIKEPVVVMQRPSHQVIINNQKQQVVSNGNIMSSSPPPLPPSGGWHQNNSNVGGGMMKSGAMTLHNPNPSTRSVSPNSLGANKLYSSHLQYQQQQQHHQQQQQQLNMMVDGSNQIQNQNQNRVNSSWNRMMGTSRTLSAASSLGLFSGLGSNSSSSGSSSPIDWTTSSSMFELDYASVDWSLDRGSRSSVGMWAGGGGGGGVGGGQNSSNNGYHHNNNQGLGGGVGGVRAGGAMRQMVAAVANGGISEMGGFKDNGGVAAATTTTTKAGGEGGGGGSSSGVGVGVGVGGGSRGEWSSPFEEKDMFSLSRQFVSSPSL